MTESTDEKRIRGWSPGVMLAEELDADRDEAVRDLLAAEGWQSMRKFCRKFDVGLSTETTFADLDAIPASVWDACGLDAPSRGAVDEFCAEYAYPLPDPQAAGESLERARYKRFNEKNRAERTLKPRGISPSTQYSIGEVERAVGETIADAARRLISDANLLAWEAPAPRPRERTYLITAGELHSTLGVGVEAIAGMQAATDDERRAAVLMLARSRRLHRDTINAPDDGGVPLVQAIRHIADMVDEPPTGVIVDGLIYEETVTHWIGDGGVYKTFTVLDLGCSVAAGRNVTGRLTVPHKRGVLYLCAERRHHGLIGDVRAWCQHNGVALDRNDLALHGLEDVVQLVNEDRMRELTDYVIEHEIKLVVVDTQSKATVGLEENSATAMNMALRNAAKLARRAKAAVIVVHHTARGQSHARGSTVWRDNSDATVRQIAIAKHEAEFVIDKHKSVEVGTRFPVKVEPVTVSADGVTFTTLVAGARDPLTSEERVERLRVALDPDDKILVEVVNGNSGAPLSPTEVHRRATEGGYMRNRDTANKHLQKLAKPENGALVVEIFDPVSKRRTYSAVTAAHDVAVLSDPESAKVVNISSRGRAGSPTDAGQADS